MYHRPPSVGWRRHLPPSDEDVWRLLEEARMELNH